MIIKTQSSVPKTLDAKHSEDPITFLFWSEKNIIKEMDGSVKLKFRLRYNECCFRGTGPPNIRDNWESDGNPRGVPVVLALTPFGPPVTAKLGTL